MLSVVLSITFLWPQAQNPASPPARHEILGTVVTVGASLTDGFGNGIPLAHPLESSIRVPHKRVGRLSSFLFFTKPREIGSQQIDRALRAKPTLVIGPDFLFWYAYGHLGKIRRIAEQSLEGELAARSWLLDQGLAQLDRLTCRIVVGDLPDMTGADPRMLSPAQVPSGDVLAKLNERIREWAKTRGDRVRVIPLARWVADMKAGKIRLVARADAGGPRVPVPADKVLANDRLHPSKLGALLFNHLLLRELRAWLGEAASGGLAFDLWRALEEKGLDKELPSPKKN